MNIVILSVNNMLSICRIDDGRLNGRLVVALDKDNVIKTGEGWQQRNIQCILCHHIPDSP